MWAVRGVWLLYVGENATPIISGFIMGSQQPRLTDLYEAPQRLSSIFAPYSCPQRETFTSPLVIGAASKSGNAASRRFPLSSRDTHSF